MEYLDSIKMIGRANNYSIGLIDEETYDPASADNVVAYKKFHPETNHNNHQYPTKMGVFALCDTNIEYSACVCSAGGGTGVHPNCSILENDRLLVCCGNSVFCLSIPELGLLWETKADSATCFGIFKFGDSYIIHGELEISRLDALGRALWKFSGPEIFTTPAGKDDFRLEAGVIEAVDWSGIKFRIDAGTGKELQNQI
jgi:hypothetical protein